MNIAKKMAKIILYDSEYELTYHGEKGLFDGIVQEMVYDYKMPQDRNLVNF